MVRDEAKGSAQDSPHVGTSHLHDPNFTKQRELREGAEQMISDHPLTMVSPRPEQQRSVPLQAHPSVLLAR